jgi:hypothetical protein
MPAPPTANPGYPPAFRLAWLDLFGDGSQVVAVEDYGRGYFCSNLDLGAPTVRAVVTNRPDADGEIDLTQFLGGRVVTINLNAYPGAGALMDAVPGLFARYMVPSARPVLHYVLNRPGNPERTLGLRASSFAWPIAGADSLALQLQFEAADPVMRNPATTSTTAYAGTLGSGRLYPLTFPRVYPTGGGSPSSGTISTPGDVAVKPKISIYGPVTQPQLTITLQNAGTVFMLAFVAGFRIDAGHRVDLDCNFHTAYYDGDPTQGVLSSIDWRYFNMAGYAPGWPVIPPAPESGVMALSGTSTSNITQAVATWADGYLT